MSDYPVYTRLYVAFGHRRLSFGRRSPEGGWVRLERSELFLVGVGIEETV